MDKSQLRQLQDAVQRILMDEWDPIGVAGIVEAREEYDSYALQVCGRLMRNVSEDELVEFLLHVETVKMGLPGDRERAERVAKSLGKLRTDMDSAAVD